MSPTCFILYGALGCMVVTSTWAVGIKPELDSAEHWNNIASEELTRAKRLQKPNIAVAKNVVFFLGDGMGVSTVTASRILKGQLRNETGEEQLLSFEEFPHVALSKTYNTDAQTADSAGTATAYLAGVKTRYGVIGVDTRVERTNCDSVIEGTKIDSILHWSKASGKSVGIVTTARITHATPAGAYAHTADRNWENDEDMKDVPEDCPVKDIAAQLIDEHPDIQVILGGGREKFLKNNTMDPEEGLLTGGRLDNRDLTEVWKTTQRNKNRSYKYVWNQTEFDAVDPTQTDYLLGLFSKSHMQYEIERKDDIGKEPSISEMAEKAIKILSRNPKGFFLLVEGGRIDHAHHASRAVPALHETLAFADAVAKAVSMTQESDTLTIATADHSHVFTIAGYPTRGNPIFGLADDRKGGLQLGSDGKPYTTLGYTNGPGSYSTANATLRPDLTNIATDDKDYLQQSAVPFRSETHGGEDVGIYAQGPMSHLFHGVHEQNYIAHVMAYASCVGRYSSPNSCAKADVAEFENGTSDGTVLQLNSLILIITTLFCFFAL